ncbi:PREDICTED: putative nuclease HARBI1 [Lupinus angustifolius]|uniref:putative nuclease HARBI1 n=1 Tax=Lupinus angustifolius TaxID=3871 RepID=UPI00092E40F6|nr:PREDICTED: putative nuclease HARBI1 [Lupinus angustifolius]
MERVMDVDNAKEIVNDDPMELINEVDLDIDEIFDIQMAEMQMINHTCQQLEMRQYIGAIILLCNVIHALHLLEVLSTCIHSRVSDSTQRDRWCRELMSSLVEGRWCRDVIRMGSQTFLRLCQKLRGTGIVKDTIRSTLEEQVAKFLQIVGQNAKNSGISFLYHRSGETVSRHFHNVLHAIISLEGEFLVQPSGRDVPPQILNKSRFYPFFKDCIGAIDGTHIRVKVPRAEAPRFRGRKEFPTQNVFAACDFDMKFTYVLAGWEGTASDSRILKDALSREDPLKIPEGKFYIGDAGFMLKRTLLTPYRGVRYHLKEYSARGPQNSRELFNHRHSSLRNVIERTFGVLKKRFPIISSGSEPHYSFETMRDIVLACCILHNFLRGVDDDISLIAEVDHELLQQDIDGSETQQRDEDYREGELLRDNIANEMWNAYQV